MSNKQHSNVPHAARKQIREANRILAELNAPPAPEGAQPNLTAQSRPGLQLAPETRFEVQQFDPNAEPAPTAQPVAAPVAREPAPQPSEAEVANHRYNVLQGKYNTETGRLMGVAQALEAENQRIMRRLAEAQQQPQAPTRREEQFDLSAVTQKEREEYGEELVALMARIAKANSGPEVARLQAQVGQLQNVLNQNVQTVTQGARERVYLALKEWDPMWEATNVSQEFLDWLDQLDIMSGLARKTALMGAFEANDAQRVVGIFKAFKVEDARSRPSAPTPAAPAVDRNSLVAPGQPRGSAAAAPNGQGGRIWSEQEINDFYSRVQRKRISEEERVATQNEINKALVEGRVRPNHGRGGVQNSV